MVSISAQNVVLVIATITAVILGLVGLYMADLIGGGVIGVTANELGNSTLNISDAMNTHLSASETGYITNTEGAADKVGLAIAIFAVVIILILFGLTGMFKKILGSFSGKISGKGPQ